MSLDRRTFNRMSEENKETWGRLEAWAKEVFPDEPRAWPLETLLSKIARCGIVGAAQGVAPTMLSRDAAIIDAAVAKLPQIDRKALVERLTSDAPIEASARKLKMRVPQLRNVIKRALWRIRGYIDRADDEAK